VLGLRADDDLTDDEVRAAWRRIAAATHPDRADGGDPERFARAASAYTDLRTTYLRNEARATRIEIGQQRRYRRALGLRRPRRAAAEPQDRAPSQPRDRAGVPPDRARFRLPGRAAARLRRGRPLRLVLKIFAAVAAGTVVVVVAGPGPAAPALIVGIATWLVLAARRDLGPDP
jgi:curved DNA-binding protein CbpA